MNQPTPIPERDLTKEYTKTYAKEPVCKRTWEKRWGHVNWHDIGRRYTVGLMTPKDFNPHYKLILHNRMFAQ